ncbi:LysR family transcriptional regulator [Variovorax ginsengisoli]|uniref:LysR family transcriptional regulator n=1 Tax=Variovorax ginsengisoli TaxID=363844 RepID=A0ABT8S8K9_9BURK|nr:LysR family transcriptional regulator [Variovorax ginsengisoli]MDN8615182.1 LysR family transcriptional regulator [Variovorax ginsengisoli]MDO1534352.1 LysR family transcriptional regulator [Variovorax ginsengisoli]
MKHTHDRLDLLDTFIKIGESGSLSKAARLLGTSQPTVSRRLLELERMLGCKLALRTTASFSLTDEGRSLLAEARDLGDRWSSLSHRLSGGQSRPEGMLRVIGPSGYGNGFLTDAVTDLRAAHPALRVELTLTDRVIDLVASGAECWICVGEVRDPDLVSRKLGAMERILLATPELLKRLGPVTIARLPSLPCVGLVPYVQGNVRLLDRSGRPRMVALDTPIKTDSLLSSYRAILNGAGIGAAAPWMCQDDLKAGRVQRVLPHWWLEPIGIHVALPPGLYRPARVTAFIDALKGRMHSLPGFRPAT